MYDWANSAMVTTIVAAVFPIYFHNVAAAHLPKGEATQRYAIATTISLVIVAMIAPILGVIADVSSTKKRLLGVFVGAGSATTSCMFLIHHGDWLLALILFMLANICAASSFVFYDALLPHVARHDEMDRLSTTGYALGYLGGGILLALNLAWIQRPEWFGLPSGDHLTAPQATRPVRLTFLSVAIWWVLFSIPILWRVREPVRRLERDERQSEMALKIAFVRLGQTFRELRNYKPAFLMLLAFMLYNDGIGTIIKMAAIYGAEIGIERGSLIAAILMVQFIGIPFTILFGALAGRIGAKQAIFLALAVYMGISVLAYFMTSATHFFVLAILVAMVQGGSQALSRSLFARMIPSHKSAQFFSFFAICEKFAGIIGPAIFAGAIALTHSSQDAILSMIIFFVAGGIVLYFVDDKQGICAAQSAETATQAEVPSLEG